VGRKTGLDMFVDGKKNFSLPESKLISSVVQATPSRDRLNPAVVSLFPFRSPDSKQILGRYKKNKIIIIIIIIKGINHIILVRVPDVNEILS
jgi:hypothetical protein